MHQQGAGEPPRLTAREDLLTVAFSAWLIGGIFVDGWAHNNDKPESFFTPWHGLFYSGFLATAAWMLSRYRRHGGIPAGYGLGFVGLALFAAGGVGDMVWHMAFGVEVDLEALLSPTHLLLFVSGILVVSSPLRAAWSDAGQRTLPLPALLSMTIVTATVAFFHMHFSPFLTDAMQAEPYEFAGTLDRGGGWLADELQLEGFSAILITTVILIAPTLLLLRRWRLPAGSLTLLFAVVVALDCALLGFEMAETIAGRRGRRRRRRPAGPGPPARRDRRPPSCGSSASPCPWSCGSPTSPCWPPSTASAGRSSCGPASPSCPASPASAWPS